ncbi:MAG: phosphoserine phosphatase [Alteromonadaceae bacterium]
MSVSVHVLPVEEIKALTLKQIISPEQILLKPPYLFNLTDQRLVIDSDCPCLAHPMKTQTNLPKNSLAEISTELVVFSDLTLTLLLRLISTCDISIIALNAINYRNSLTSYRFLVRTNDLQTARQKLSVFSMLEKIETALTDNAPLLGEPGILVMDMDSTTIEIECIDEIAILAGVGEQVAAVTELAMQGKLDFAQSLHQRVATLAGSSEDILAAVAKNIPLMPGLETLVSHLQQYHWRIAIASGGFTYFADHLKDLLKIDAAFANQLEIIDGKLTGKVLGKVVDAQVKADCLLKLSKQYQIPHQQTVAMGDGANDLVMMAAASLGIAFHAKDIVKKQADTAIHFTGLDCMLHWLK